MRRVQTIVTRAGGVRAKASPILPPPRVSEVLMPSLYIDEFVGISNRLEVLPLAFAIHDVHGHDIVLDWHELDSFSVDGTRRGRVWPWTKIGAVRVRHCDEAIFASLAGRKVILRSLDGPDALLKPRYLDAARRVHLAPALAESVRATFARHAGRPVVAVHLRQGDYRLVSTERYDIGTEWPAVPLWWYRSAMTAIRQVRPDTAFFLAGNGDPMLHAELVRDFDVFTLEVESHYGYKKDDHSSRVNPVADLFALACCPVLLATPVSGFSHWAANALGTPSTCIVPMPGATPVDARMGRVDLYGERLPRWRAAGRTGSDTTPLSATLDGIDLSRTADCGWL